jgi:two-component system response regulator TctD
MGLTRVLVVDDEPMVREVLQRYLELEGFEVAVAEDGEAALASFTESRPDLVVLDLMLPEIDGLEVCRQLRAESSVPIIMLTAKTASQDRVAGLDTGADDYLAKPFQLAELEARIKALIRRAHGSANPQITLGPLDYDSAGRMFRLHGLPLALRPKEHAVLEVLVLRAGKVVGKESLFEKAFNLDATTNPEAIEIYVCRLRKKLEGSGVSIVTVRGLGYVLETASAA